MKRAILTYANRVDRVLARQLMNAPLLIWLALATFAVDVGLLGLTAPSRRPVNTYRLTPATRLAVTTEKPSPFALPPNPAKLQFQVAPRSGVRPGNTLLASDEIRIARTERPVLAMAALLSR